MNCPVGGGLGIVFDGRWLWFWRADGWFWLVDLWYWFWFNLWFWYAGLWYWFAGIQSWFAGLWYWFWPVKLWLGSIGVGSVAESRLASSVGWRGMVGSGARGVGVETGDGTAVAVAAVVAVAVVGAVVAILKGLLLGRSREPMGGPVKPARWAAAGLTMAPWARARLGSAQLWPFCFGEG